MVRDEPHSEQPQHAFDELARLTLANHSVGSVMTTIAQAGTRLLPGVDQVSVTMIETGRPTTVASTGATATAMDERQYQDGTGPCLEAATSGIVQLVPDATSETRWPGYATAAGKNGVRSSLSMPVPVHAAVSAALNMYSHQPAAFSHEDVELAQVLAGYASVALANIHLYNMQGQVAENLKIAMESRAIIEQAKGLLIGERRCTAEQAFQVLVGLSQDSNRKLRDVAQALIASALPPHEPPGR